MGLDLPEPDWGHVQQWVDRLVSTVRSTDVKIRCKFKVTGVEDNGSTESHNSKKVTLTTHYDPTLPEDQRFTRWTPTGTINVVIDNAAALEQLTPGKDFYVDLTPVG